MRFVAWYRSNQLNNDADSLIVEEFDEPPSPICSLQTDRYRS